jgi:NADH-quinone oxidoreductase subunit F
MQAFIESVIALTGKTKDKVIPILQAVQKEYNYLPAEALFKICELTEISQAQIEGVASFYSQFRHFPAGKHLVKVCVGTACHVKGALQVYDALERELNLEAGQDTDAQGMFTIEKVSCLGCCTLAPVVQIDEVTYGHVSRKDVPEMLANFTDHQKGKDVKPKRISKTLKPQGEIRLGLGSCCVASGSKEVQEALAEVLDNTGIQTTVKHVGCVGMCHQVPLLEIIPEGKPSSFYSKVKPEDVKDIVLQHFKSPGVFNRLKSSVLQSVEKLYLDVAESPAEQCFLDMKEKPVDNFLNKQKYIATEHKGSINPLDIDEYLQNKGFQAFRNCLVAKKPAEIIAEIKESGLRGRGGAGFTTGLKWELAAKETADIKYIICNGDEGDPGAFMDRMLLESFPFRVIEGMLIAAFATGATHGYFYIRAEYPLAVMRISEALKECRKRGFVGENILKSGFSLEIEIFEGAGAFVCGEETALIASIEGDRGMPVIRPPFPVQQGLHDKPTLVNNVESLSNVPWILLNGAKKFAEIGTAGSKGTKVFALAGKIARGGLIEVPMGTTIREVVEDIGGGIANGRTFKAVQIGGPSGGCIPASMADTPIDYLHLTQVGAMMGSGGLVVLDDTDCVVDIAKYFLTFTQDQSCGKCVFCRVGTKHLLNLLEKICEGKGTHADLAKLEELSEQVMKGSLCGLGRSAPNPVITTLKYFREEYEAHIQGKCPAKKCKDLIYYTISDLCIGCTKCAQDCPTQAIEFNPYEVHKIDHEKCIKCDICKQVCPVNAVNIL